MVPGQQTAGDTTKMNRCRNKPPRLQLKMQPQSLVRSRTTSSMWDSRYDPFQVFEVEHEACLDLEIVIKKGESITKGSTLKDFVDTPDPYVIMKIPGSSNPSKRTSHVDNCVSPIWDETFHFFLDPSKEHELNVILMDANYTVDENLGDDKFCINQLTNDVPTDQTFYFHGGSKVHTTLKLQKNKTPDLRFSLALCQKEKDFLQIRRKKVLAAMQRVLGTKAPDTERQVPIIGILGSGGGFRAMTCLSGAIKALHESGILDCATYISGLSGSSWYISTLYAHDNFPEVTHDQIQKELRESVTKDWKRMLINALSYVSSMIIKYKQGQPVSFTDFFGHLLGDVLLKGQKHKKLTDTQRILARGAVPLPLYTCLHAKKKVSCRSFSEWVEFSPYEIGIAKYGTFMKTEDFGNKFIVGKKIKHFEELPLHFLQGVWGSAFTILIKRLVMEGGKKDMVQIMRDAQQENNLEDNLKDTLSSGESSDTEDEEDIQGKDDKESEEEDLGITVESHCFDSDKFYECPSLAFGYNNSHCRSDGESSILPQQKNDQNKAMLTTKSLDLDSLKLSERDQKQNRRKISEPFSFDFTKKKSSRDNRKESTISDPGVSTNYQTAQESRLNRQGAFKASRLRKQANVNDVAGKNVWANRRKTLRKSRVDKKAGFWDALKQNIMTGTNILNSRAGRAGEVLNPFRGLSLRHSFPISPFAADAMAEDEDQEDQVDSDMEFGASCRYKSLDNTAKKLFIVDSGLAFNSPYPLLLRPQRAVDIYLSFDFSQRPKDSSPPFKELLLAEKWAIQNKVPFPPIQKQIEQYENEEVRECYVFKHPDDQFCPVILHFPLINNKFRDFKAPGVPRETDEEKQFADFPIFDDPQNPFSSMNFVYEPLQYDRLTKLVEFNTLSCIDTIKKEIEEAVVRQKNCIKVSFDSVVNTFSRVSSFCKKVDASCLRLTVSEEKKRQFKNLALREAGRERQVSNDSSEGEFSDALEELPDESSHL